MEFSVGSGSKFTGHFSSNVEGIARDHMSFRFSISCSIPEIFAIKVRSGRKSPELLHVFDPHFFWGGGVPPNFWTKFISSNQLPIMWQSFTAIGRGSSERTWRKEKKEKKTARAKYKTSRTTVTDGLINKWRHDITLLLCLCSGLFV